MQHTTFSWRSGSEQLKLFGQVWQPIDAPSAVIALVHGMGEHSGRYRKFAEFFTERGFAVMAFDQRGHGKSEGKKGHITHYNQLLEGVDELLERVRIRFPNIPVILWGHSMGGNVVLNYILKKPTGIKAVVATSPWIRLAFNPPVLQLRLARIMRNLYPGFTQRSGLKTKFLSRDAAVVQAYEKDKLVHDKISASFFVNVFNAGYYLLQHANNLKIPTLLMHAGEDKITSADASKDFAEKASLLTELKIWEGLYHEIHNEPENEQVLTYAVNWIKKQLPS